MALTDENGNSNGFVMPVSPLGGYGNQGGGFFGNDFAWVLLLLLIGGNGFGFGGFGGGMWPMMMGGMIDQVPDSAAIIHTQGNVVYIGRNPNVPEVGDVRITFTKDMPSKVSIIAKIVGDTFTYYKAKNGYKLDLLYMGENTAEEMFDSEHSTNKIILWILRILGILIIIGGLRSIVSIVPTLLKVLPFLGGIVETGLGLVCGIVGLVWSLIVIAIAWIRYRPVLGICLLVIAAALIFLLVRRSRRKKAAKAGMPDPQTPQTPQAPEIQIPQPQREQPSQPQMTPEQQKEFEQWKQFQEFKKMQDQMKNNNGQ